MSEVLNPPSEITSDTTIFHTELEAEQGIEYVYGVFGSVRAEIAITAGTLLHSTSVIPDSPLMLWLKKYYDSLQLQPYQTSCDWETFCQSISTGLAGLTTSGSPRAHKLNVLPLRARCTDHRFIRKLDSIGPTQLHAYWENDTDRLAALVSSPRQKTRTGIPRQLLPLVALAKTPWRGYGFQRTLVESTIITVFVPSIGIVASRKESLHYSPNLSLLRREEQVYSPASRDRLASLGDVIHLSRETATFIEVLGVGSPYEGGLCRQNS